MESDDKDRKMKKVKKVEEEEEEEEEGGVIDGTAGSLVWVRRRNGSWWPGRILGLGELPDPCRNLTRSGTPIKLLGREDGSLDWYNLERSKRVKAFRCGEYDDCIQRAKDHALRTKRKYANAGKYVRREEAILHALELEEEANSIRGQKFHSRNKSSIGTTHKGPGHAARKVKKLEQSAKNKQLMQKKRWRTPNDSEDDTADGMKRMRDLQDLGLGKNLKRKPKRCHGLTPVDGASLSESDLENDLYSDSPINSSRDSCPSLKKKRSHVTQAYENLKRRYRRRSLSKVWMDASKVKLPSVCHQSATISEESSLQGVKNIEVEVRADNSTSRKKGTPSIIAGSPDYKGTSCEDTLLDTVENTGSAAIGGSRFHSGMKDKLYSSVVELIDNDFSNGFVDIPVMGGDNPAGLSSTFRMLPSTMVNSGTDENPFNHRIRVGLVSQLNEVVGAEACSTGSSTQVNNVTRHKVDMGEWHTKGKRNVRMISLNKNVNSETSFVDQMTDPSDSRTQKETANNTSDGSLTSDSSCQLVKCTMAELNEKPKVSMVNGHVKNLLENATEEIEVLPSSVEALDSTTMMPKIRVPLPPRRIRLPSRYRDSSEQENSHQLFDVELNVQSNGFQGERVPLVSLMSKFNGKAIVGHPVTVEILSSISIKQLCKERVAGTFKSQLKVEHKTTLKDKACTSIGVLTRSPSPLLKKKMCNGKKSSFSPSRKIRRLSSFTADRSKEKQGRRKPSFTEKIGGPAVSCIPLRLVFSRLNEALSSSSRPTN